MKRFFLILVTTVLFLCGCASSSSGSTCCTDEGILAQFSGNGQTAEFALDGTCYTLPLEVSAFTQNGWQIKMIYPAEEMEFEEVTLLPDEVLTFRFIKGEKTLTAEIINTSDQKMPLNEESMITGIIMSESDWEEDSFVVTGGIRMGTSMADAKASLKDFESFEDDGHFYELGMEKDGFNESLLRISGNNSVDFIQVQCEDANYHTSYLPSETKAENAESHKELYKADCESYAVAYNEIIDALEKGEAQGTKFHIAGEIIEKTAGKTLLLYADDSEGTALYIVQNEAGEQYAFYAENAASETSQIPELASGDSVEVWGSFATILLADGNKIPVMYVSILEKDRTEVFLADTFLR